MNDDQATRELPAIPPAGEPAEPVIGTPIYRMIHSGHDYNETVASRVDDRGWVELSICGENTAEVALTAGDARALARLLLDDAEQVAAREAGDR